MPKENRPERCRISGRFEVKRAAAQQAEDGTFSGYGSVFDEPHETSSWMLPMDWSDVMSKGAFKVSLSEHKKRGTLPAMLLQHDMYGLPIGAYSEVREDDRGLYVEGQLALKVQKAADTYELMKIGAMRGLSIGFRPTAFELDEKKKLRTITEVDLWEISPVTIPADPLALVDDVKARGGNRSIRDFENFLREAGWSRREAKAIAAKGWNGIAPQRDAEDDDSASPEGADLLASVESLAEDWSEAARRESESKAQGVKQLFDSIEDAGRNWTSLFQRDAEKAIGETLESLERITDVKTKK